MNLNKVLLIGRVVEAPDKRVTPSGQSVCTIRIATNRVWNKDGQMQEETEFHTVVLWRRLADIAAQYLQKGALVQIEGRLKTRSWESKTTGGKQYKTEIIAENMQLGPRSSGEGRAAQQQQAPEKTQQPEPQEEIPIIQEDEEIDVKDIPF